MAPPEAGRTAGALTGWLRGLSPRAEAVLVLGVCFGYLSAVSVAAFFRGRHVSVSTDARIAWLFAFELFATAAALLILRARGARDVLGRMRVSIPDTSRGAILWIAILLVSVASAMIARACGLRPAAANSFRFVHRESWWVAMPFFLFNSYFEERFVVGFLVGALEKKGPLAAVAASSAVRFLYHTYQGWLAVLYVLPLGLLFATEYWRKRNLYPLILAHTAFNAVSLLRSAG